MARTATERSKAGTNGASVGNASAESAQQIDAWREGIKAVVVVGCLQLGRGDSDLDRSTFNKINESLRDAHLPDKSEVIVDLWLDSPGGSARDAYKIALLLRSIGTHIRVIIPDYAKSAATLLSLVADEIYMAPAAELGPLDAQFDYEKNPGMTVSALDRIGNLNEITEAARDIVLGLGIEVRYRTRLGRSETVAVMADLASKLLQPLVAQVDPTILHKSNRTLKEAVDYGKRLMLTREGCPHELAKELPERLTKQYPTHGYAISIEEARELGLPVKPMKEYEYAEQVSHFYEDKCASHTSVVGLVKVVSLRAKPSNGGGVANGRVAEAKESSKTVNGKSRTKVKENSSK